MVSTSRGSVISFTVCVCGTFTSIPDWMIGAVSIKIISNTSTTSTKGVMLISESELCVRPWELVNAIKTYFTTESGKKTKPGLNTEDTETQRKCRFSDIISTL